jgi:hypothetical protein
MPDALALVIEITSANRETDLGLKKDWYGQWNVPYLVVDRAYDPYWYRSFGDMPDWVAGLLLNRS